MVMVMNTLLLLVINNNDDDDDIITIIITGYLLRDPNLGLILMCSL